MRSSRRYTTHRVQRRAAALILLLLGLITALGCGGPERVAVEGSVTVNGRSLEHGSIVFVPTGESTGPKSAAEIRNGKFSIPADQGPIVGAHKIEIYAEEAPDYAMDDPLAHAESAPARGPRNLIPPEYNEFSDMVRETKKTGQTGSTLTYGSSNRGVVMSNEAGPEVDHPEDVATERQSDIERPRLISSADLFQGKKEVLILHDSATYRLRITRHGKLILNK